jgi:hypothetical protein
VILKLFYAVDYDEMRIQAYLSYQMAPFGAAALYLGCAFLWLEKTGRWRNLLAAVLALAVIAPAAWTNGRRNDRSADTFAFDYARTLLDLLPPNAILFAYGDPDLGPLAYAHHVEGVRPDVRLYSQFGYLFRNRLSSPLDFRLPAARSAMEDFIADEGRVYFSWDAMELSRDAPFSRHEYGPLHEFVSEPRASYEFDRKELGRKLRESARFFLDSALEQLLAGEDRIRWRYFWEANLSGFCHVLSLHDLPHPLIEKVPRCRWIAARIAWRRGDYERALPLFRSLPDAPGLLLTERQAILAETFSAAVDRLHDGAEPWSAELERYQALADEVRSRVDDYPVCNNPILVRLLLLRARVPVDIGLDALRARFGICPGLKALFDEAVSGSGEGDAGAA